MPNGTYGGVRGRKTKVGRKLLRFPPTRFHRQGHAVAIAGRRLENLKHISTELGDCPYAQIDVTDTQATLHLQELIENLGGMDIYLHVSGIGKQNRQLDTAIELSTVETNVMGFTRLINHAWHYFAQKGHGHIAAVTSIAGTKGMGAAPSYSATKRYCNTYLEALSQLASMKGLDITFTDIRPGFVDTDLLSKDFHYPMMMKPQPVARSIVRGVLSGRRIVTIDWRFRILVFFWRLIPSSIWERMKIG